MPRIWRLRLCCFSLLMMSSSLPLYETSNSNEACAFTTKTFWSSMFEVLWRLRGGAAQRHQGSSSFLLSAKYNSWMELFFWQSSHTNFFSRLFMESFFKDPALLLLHCSAIIISNVRLSSKTFFLLTALRSPFSLFSMYLLILYLRPFSHWETNVFLFVPCRHVVDFLLSGSLLTVYNYPSKSLTIFQWDFYGRFYTVCLQGNDAGNLWKTRHFCQGHLLIIPGFTFRSTVAVKSFEDVKKFRFATFVLM